MRRTNLVLAAEQLESAIADYCSAGRGLSKKQAPLMAELLRYVAFQQEPTELTRLGRPWRSVRSAVERLGESLQINTYIMGRFGYDKARIANLGGLRAADASYIARLSRLTGVPLTRIADEIDPEIQALVEAQVEDLVLYLDERALEDILLAAMESYAVSAGRGRPYTEVYGVCFGSRRDKEVVGSRTTNGLKVIG